MLLARLRGGGTMVLGTFAEVVVADLLPGSILATLGTDSVDLTWGDLGIQVKCSTKARPSWKVPEALSVDPDTGKKVKDRRADLYVLARPHGDHLSTWTFHVVPTWWLNARNRKEVGLRAVVDAGYRAVAADGLVSAIQTAPVAPQFTQPGMLDR